jgi:hypothetical protein
MHEEDTEEKDTDRTRGGYRLGMKRREYALQCISFHFIGLHFIRLDRIGKDCKG